jgi:hypothetical protein
MYKGSQIFRSSLNSALIDHTHHEIHVIGFLYKPFIYEVFHLPEHTVMIDLHLRLDVSLQHLRGESLQFRTMLNLSTNQLGEGVKDSRVQVCKSLPLPLIQCFTDL